MFILKFFLFKFSRMKVKPSQKKINDELALVKVALKLVIRNLSIK